MNVLITSHKHICKFHPLTDFSLIYYFLDHLLTAACNKSRKIYGLDLDFQCFLTASCGWLHRNSLDIRNVWEAAMNCPYSSLTDSLLPCMRLSVRLQWSYTYTCVSSPNSDRTVSSLWWSLSMAGISCFISRSPGSLMSPELGSTLQRSRLLSCSYTAKASSTGQSQTQDMCKTNCKYSKCSFQVCFKEKSNTWAFKDTSCFLSNL